MGGLFHAGGYPKMKNLINLPSGYTKLAYIQSSGTQYINTGWIPKSMNFQIEIGYMITGTAADQSIFGADEVGLTLNLMVGSSTFQLGINTWHDVVNPLCTTNLYSSTVLTSRQGYQELIVNDQSIVNATQTNLTSMNSSLALFTNHKNSGTSNDYYATGRIYYFRCSENGVVVRDFVPCLSDANGVGLYDLVNNQFYGNAGSGSFIGSEVA